MLVETRTSMFPFTFHSQIANQMGLVHLWHICRVPIHVLTIVNRNRIFGAEPIIRRIVHLCALVIKVGGIAALRRDHRCKLAAGKVTPTFPYVGIGDGGDAVLLGAMRVKSSRYWRTGARNSV